MTVYFIIGGIEGFPRIIRIRCMYMFTLYYPNTDAFVPSCINIPCIFDRHLCICCIQTTGMLMIQALTCAYKYFPEWPVVLYAVWVPCMTVLVKYSFFCVSCCCFANPGPSSCAFLLASNLSLLQGPFPFTTSKIHPSLFHQNHNVCFFIPF